ncbi:DNA/RNA non-specific endonuclease [Salipaludibacillus sp. HK11]
MKDGKQVNVNVKLEYSGNSKRPSTFEVQYEIDGERFIKNLLN